MGEKRTTWKTHSANLSMVFEKHQQHFTPVTVQLVETDSEFLVAFIVGMESHFFKTES